MRKPLPSLVFTVVMAVSATAALSAPRVLVTENQREEVVKKLQTAEWANVAFTRLKERIDFYVAKTEAETEWATSRLAMHWDNHYVRTITESSRSVGGEGRAPVPTPRFSGARDWKTAYTWPDSIDAFLPYNDRNDKILLIHKETGLKEWVDPAITGHAIRRINEALLELAADAAFVYWITGEDRYARLAAPILWTYMHGFSYVKPPRIGEDDARLRRIIGSATYEVIHDEIIQSVAIAYDFLRDYIAESSEIDGGIIEAGIKTFLDRIIAGGNSVNNWNIHQNKRIAFGGLALKSDASYTDGKGRQYYVDIVLNAELANQRGILHVIRDGYPHGEPVWPEAPGYAFDTTANIVEIASLLANDPAGRKVLENPLLSNAVLYQVKQTYPSGISHGVGNTSYSRVDTNAAELMVSWFVSQNRMVRAAAFSAMLHRELENGAYSRDKANHLMALTRYVAHLPEPDQRAIEQTSTYYATAIDIAMLRNMPASGGTAEAIAATLFGTRGWHMHSNGLAIELYGAGHVLGVDSGRGSSYWQSDHNDYYRQPPSHNTVIPMGRASYPSRGDGTIAMDILTVEPAFNSPATRGDLTYMTSGFHYKEPAASQQRTLALVRVNDKIAFFFDVMRSRLDEPESGEYHDWLYHAMAGKGKISGLELKPSNQLTSAKGNLAGYDFFQNERSVRTPETIHVSFPLEIGSDNVGMNVWMAGGDNRRVFLADAPANRAARFNYPASDWDHPIPLLLVRHYGEAWDDPFVTVYEPYHQIDGPTIKAVVEIAPNRWQVIADNWKADLQMEGMKLNVRIQDKE